MYMFPILISIGIDNNTAVVAWGWSCDYDFIITSRGLFYDPIVTASYRRLCPISVIIWVEWYAVLAVRLTFVPCVTRLIWLS
jgi:hypothetical protein